MKPILFNTEMVRAILDGRKSVTRRVVKPQYDDLIKIENGGVFYADKSGEWCPIEGNTWLAKQRLYGRDGRSYLLSNEIRRIWSEGIYGLVSAKGTSGEDGVSFDFHMPQKQEKDDECSQSYLQGISWGASSLCSSTSHGRGSIEQCSRKLRVGDCSRELGRQKAASQSNNRREAPDVKTDRFTKSGNPEFILPRNESEENRRNILCKSICNLEIIKIPFSINQILYVRETWTAWSRTEGLVPKLYYKADGDAPNGIKWHPSIHMPKEAARLFLRVTGVRVERLQDIDYDGCKEEGIWDDYKTLSEKYHENLARRAYPVTYANLWDSTIKKADLTSYGWEANPWVFVIEFERISKEEAKGGKWNG